MHRELNMEKITHEIIELSSPGTLRPFGLSESTSNTLSSVAVELDTMNKRIQLDGTITDDGKLVKSYDSSVKNIDKINEILISQIKKSGAEIEGLKENLYSSELKKESYDTSLTGHFANTWDGKSLPTNREQQKMVLAMHKAGFVDDSMINVMDAKHSHPDVLTGISERKRVLQNTEAIMGRVSSFSQKYLREDVISRIKSRMI